MKLRTEYTKRQVEEMLEAMEVNKTKVVEYRWQNESDWYDMPVGSYCGPYSDYNGELRFVRPKPTPTRRPWTMADVPPVCWIRVVDREDIPSDCYSVTGVSLAGIQANQQWHSFRNFDKMEYSTDLKTWSSDFTVEVAG